MALISRRVSLCAAVCVLLLAIATPALARCEPGRTGNAQADRLVLLLCNQRATLGLQSIVFGAW